MSNMLSDILLAATIGCALAVLREVSGDPTMHVAPEAEAIAAAAEAIASAWAVTTTATKEEP